jgi:hypothetical protein
MNTIELILKKPLHLNMKKSIQILPKDKKQMELVSKWLLENNIKFEEIESPYNVEIVNKVLEGMKDVEKGNYTTFSSDLLWK